MSASDTELETQKRRHLGPILGITGGLIVVAFLLVTYLTNQVEPGDNGLFGQAEADIGAAQIATD